MALQGSGEIKMSQIVAEKGATAGSSAVNISLKGLSVDGTSDYQAAGSQILIDTPGEPSSPDGDAVAPYGMSEFYNYSQFSSVSTSGTFQQFYQGKAGNVRRRMTSLSDYTLRLGSGSTIYNISFIESEPSTAPASNDTDHIQNIQIFGYVSGNQESNPPNAWSTLTMGGNSSITWSIARSAMTSSVTYSSSAGITYWNFSTGTSGSTVYLPSSGTGTLTFS